MDRPLRLEAAEAVALVVALRALRAQPGMASAAVDSALAKLTIAAGDALPAEDALTVTPADGGLAAHVAQVLEVARQGRRAGVRVVLRYVSASDEVTERTVEPQELTSDGDHWYLRAWCLRAGAIRHFRLDRVLSAQLTSDPVTHAGRGAASGGVRPEEASFVARLTLTPRSRWVAERYEGRIVEVRPDRIDVELDVANAAWLDQLLLRLGGDVLAVAPAQVAARVAARARAALQRYEAGEAR